ncbi:metal ABC transporter substrate-binding protein [Cohnella cholangitidis]|uniref:Zinc ABC transporter substrate-binding protein n=1 Tax=Cohnella cholangitidis TaxID=2598458 RepID=A0A7G5C7Q8_9BACL|nr:metal ABC transporter substrate-binding protein [Cohnella cholangitidis]QMV45242.1 zinc ABC transporter substrate-binding protein [Cohnella cholangitidis]
MKLAKGLAGAAIAVLVLSGCGNSSGNSEGKGNKLQVIATFYPMVEFTQQVAGDHAEVVGLIPSGAEPHDWEPTPKDVAAIQEADLFVYNGVVEGWVNKTLESAKNNKRVDVKATDGISLMEGTAEHEEGQEDEHAEDEHLLDPHVWLSPKLAQQEVRHIQAGLEKADPDNKEDYKKNAEAYIEKLKALDEKFKKELSGAKHKEFVTQHAAFGYLAKEYGLTQIPIAGLSPEQEPSPEEMAEVVKFAKEHDVKTIFFETLVDPNIAQTIADEINAKTGVLNPIEGLTDEDISKGLDYIGIMENNLTGLIKALNE